MFPCSLDDVNMTYVKVNDSKDTITKKVVNSWFSMCEVSCKPLLSSLSALVVENLGHHFGRNLKINTPGTLGNFTPT